MRSADDLSSWTSGSVFGTTNGVNSLTAVRAEPLLYQRYHRKIHHEVDSNDKL